MVPGIIHIVLQSVKFYKKPVFYQVLIIALLAAVISGSLMTGNSVRESLKRSASEKLGKTGIVISSGTRYFDSSIAKRFSDSADIECTGIIELHGFSQSMLSQKEAFNTFIYAVDSDFFSFHGIDSLQLTPGEIMVNRRLADNLGITAGEEIIIRFNEISDIPADAPFAPSKESGKSSAVFKVGKIIESSEMGNFSLSISQIVPQNIFISLDDLSAISGKADKINRLLLFSGNLSLSSVYTSLKSILRYSDIGMTIRLIKATDEYELISDRIFIDESILQEVKDIIPEAEPVITYLGNRFSSGTYSTPYSFVSALPSSIYPEITNDNGIIINSWLAGDLNVLKGDTLQMFWYSPDSLNMLAERSSNFIIKDIVSMTGIWSDSLLMPEFPGISGSESCSNWDAGVPVKITEIRDKDEEYWNKYAGTPKAFINYSKGKEIWGNNYGPATSIRFPGETRAAEIENKLKGAFDPDKSGFTLYNISEESQKAANESVDFSTLFLSLGFFLIVASIVLLSFAASTYFDSKSGQINTLHALGFKNKWIKKLLFFESGIIALIGGIIGAIAGYFVNILITVALNSVWSGAVQTNTLHPFFDIIPILTGFLITIITVLIFLAIKINRYLKRLNRSEKQTIRQHSPKINLLFLLATLLISVGLFVLSFIIPNQEISLSFIAGAIMLSAFILFWRLYFISPSTGGTVMNIRRVKLSKLYYSIYPSSGVAPIMFIAAGIFAVFITGANKMDFSKTQSDRSGGTGGYLLWCENTISVKEDLNEVSGRKINGLDEDNLNDMRFVQAKRSSGDDASCLNLNHITAPPLLGLDAENFISAASFSFSKSLNDKNIKNPWQYLGIPPSNHTIYGIADQTVLEWGLKIKVGDTLIMRSENGQPLNIIIAAGLKSSIFQGNLLIGLDNFSKYYPSVSGSSVLLVEGKPELTDVYKEILNDRLNNHGINIEKTSDRLASFYEVTNTYLAVFGVFGAFGMITGIAGMGFVLIRNYNSRKREFALMMACGFAVSKIKRIILSEQMLILFAGVTAGLVSAIIATFPSLRTSPDIPWLYLLMMTAGILVTGIITLFLSIKSVTEVSLTSSLKKE